MILAQRVLQVCAEFSSHAFEDWLVVISGDLGISRRAEKGVKQTRFGGQPTLIESISQYALIDLV